MRQVILNFHGIGAPERPLEPGEAAYWVTPDMFAGALDLAVGLMDRVRTTITFDDGNASDLAIAAPELERRDMRAIFFPLAGRIGQPGSLSAADLRALAAAGHEIGSHGACHVDWTALDDRGAAREWTWARTAIADAAGSPVTAAAIPFGRYRRRVLDGLGQAGFARVYSSDGGAWRDGDRPIPRTSPRADMTLADIEAVILGRESPVRRARRALSAAVKARL